MTVWIFQKEYICHLYENHSQGGAATVVFLETGVLFPKAFYRPLIPLMQII
jgi:hypothetical protein